MFRDDFVWGVASSAFQVEGTDENDGRGRNVWDKFTEDGYIYENHTANKSADHMHRFREDYALMKTLGIKAYRFSINWARLIPNGVGNVNEKAVKLYRDMLISMRENGIEPYITLFHWEYPEELFKQGGWLNEKSPEWFMEYAKVVAENFSDLCKNFITINEPQCVIGLGHLSGAHAPGLKLSYEESFLATHNLLKAHGMAVRALREYAKQEIRIGYAPTCGVAYPETDSKEDIEAAKKVYFGLSDDPAGWAWNVSWFSDPVLKGAYPEEGLKKFAKYLPKITKEDMELISEPIDFYGQNIYNGYMVRAGKDGNPELVDRYPGFPRTAIGWPVTPRAFYYGIMFLSERYDMPLYITENGMSCHDQVSSDGRVHDNDRIAFLDAYISEMQRACDDGAKIVGYFLWTFLDNFEWADGYKERFGIVYVDYTNEMRIVKDSAKWYKKVCETNGKNLAINRPYEDILFMEPHFAHTIWGGDRIREEYAYSEKGNDIGECWGIAAHRNGSSVVKNGVFKGLTLSEVYKKYPEVFGNLKDDKFPLLIKIIDAKEDLSIQVHPDEIYASANENGESGKTECWYILDCKKDATIIYGHNAENKAELATLVNEDRWDELIREIPVKKGDLIQINPGTVHSIKAGTVLLEIQQNSDITYRIYDYNRECNGKKRELNIAKGLDVICVPSLSPASSVLDTTHLNEKCNMVNTLYDCRYYTVAKIIVKENFELYNEFPFVACAVVNGAGIVNDRQIKKGDFFIIPSGLKRVFFEGNLEVIISRVENS